MQKKVTQFKVVYSENPEPQVLDPNTYIDFIKCLVDVSKRVNTKQTKRTSTSSK